MDKKKIRMTQRALLRWYAEKGRDLPWRHTHDPYKVLVSEIMLQQTQVDRVIPKYQVFLKAFPTVRHLACAPRSRVIRSWAGLGYNRRAVYLHNAAKIVVEKFSGTVPTTIEELRTLPGVGEYTAGAVACFSGKSRDAFLDTNIKRVVGRLFFNAKTRRLPVEKKLAAYAQSLVPTQKDDAYFWHHALMDLGALVCTAAKPKCDECPLKRSCPFPPFRDTTARTHYARRQLTFKDSDRFWRGRIINAARQQKFVSAPALKTMLGINEKRIAALTAGLVRDGLLAEIFAQKKRTFSLPE